MSRALRLGVPDRVPVMCQLAIGHYFLNTGIDPVDIWFRSQRFAEALVHLCERYRFDGILVNLPGRDPEFERAIDRIERSDTETVVRWKNGCWTTVPLDDNPLYYQPDGTRYFPSFDEVDPDRLYYIEPWDITGITYPFTWGFEKDPRPFEDFFPAYHADAVRMVKEIADDRISVHSEIFSPWSQFLELLNYESGLMALIQDPGKVKACLERLTEGAIDLALRQVQLGVDAVLISSAFAGAGFISPKHYREFVQPYERRIVEAIKKSNPGVPVYTHTCGSIGDRLELMVATGTNGIDTLDPPPLGTVDLVEAKRILAGKVFIKGNIDPVNTLLSGTVESIRKDVIWRLEVGKPGGGYILSSACSVAPRTPPEHIEILTPLAEEHGRY